MSRLLLITIFFGVIALIGFFYFFQIRDWLPSTANVWSILKMPEASDSTSSPQADSASSSQVDTQGKRYVNQAFGFSFVHPEEVSVTEFADEDGTIVLAQKSGGESFQVFITPFDEPGPITAERIEKDLPGMQMEQPQEVQLAGELGISTLVFFSTQNGTRTREAWFFWPEDPEPDGNYLYQITAPAEFDPELSRIMATFSFN